jgi:hypothetical protein
MNDPLSETQTLLIKVVANQENMAKKLDKIEEHIKDYPITKSDVARHNDHHKHHFKTMAELKADVDKAKGWAAALGAAIGAVAGYFGGNFRNP